MKSLIIISSVLWISIAFANVQNDSCPPGARYYPTIDRCGEVQGVNETLEEKWRREMLEIKEAEAKKKHDLELGKAKTSSKNRMKVGN